MGDLMSARENVAAVSMHPGDKIVLAQLTRLTGKGGTGAYESFLYFAHESDANAVREELAGDGYDATVAPGQSDKPFAVIARRVLPADPLVVVALRRQMESLAAANNGEFDGWGASRAEENAALTAQAFARPRLATYQPVEFALKWPRERHEQIAREITERPDAQLTEVAVEDMEPRVEGLIRTWNWRAAVKDLDEEIETGAFLQLRLLPKNAVDDAERSPNSWARESSFLHKDVRPVFPMPTELRRPRYHFLLNLKDKAGNLAGRYVAFERTDTARDARTWDVERFALAARALGIWQAHMSRDAAALAHPVLLRDALAQLVPQDKHKGLFSNPFAKSIEKRPLIDGLRERCTQTVCHNLVSAVSLFEDPNDPSITVLRSWDMVGVGALGSDIAALVCQAPQSERIDVRDLQLLETRALERYVEGLREGGWTGDPAEIRWAYAATAGLIFATPDAHQGAVERTISARAQHLAREAAAAF